MFRQEQAETDHRSAPLPTDVQLARTLHILAGAEVLDVALTYKVASGTVYYVLRDTVVVLDKFLRFQMLSRSQQELQKLARSCRLLRSEVNPLDGNVGALDGI